MLRTFHHLAVIKQQEMLREAQERRRWTLVRRREQVARGPHVR
jgi:hypothetical protein